LAQIWHQVDVDRNLAALERAAGLEDLQTVIAELCETYRIDHMVYHWVNSQGDQYGCGTYSPAWVERYLENDYLRIDPVIQGCYQRFHPVDWKRYGVGNQGFSIPMRGPNGQYALFTTSHNCTDEEWQAFKNKHRRQLILLAHFFNQKALEFEPERIPKASRTLSPRETDAMTFLAMGFNRAKAADTMEISEHTLRVYIESARFKLGAVNTTHAVARAMSRGLIVV